VQRQHQPGRRIERKTTRSRQANGGSDPAGAARTILTGYRVETDWRPVRVELVAPGRGWVDLHPVVFDSRGHGRQADVYGGCFDCPPEAFTEGVLERLVVPCLSREQQMRFHRGYVPRAVDVHDLRLLEELASTP